MDTRGAGRHVAIMAVLLAAVGVTACGSDGGGDLGGGPDPAVRSAARSEPSGNGQSAVAGEDLANPLRIVVLRGDTPEAGAVVTWSTTGASALVTPAVDTTGADGISISRWHLGTGVGTQNAQASVTGGAEGSPVRFTATATPPGGGPETVEVQLRNDGGNRFEPRNVTIAVGTTVTWTWVGGFHDVTSTGDPAFAGSGDPISPPHSYSYTFTTAGAYRYFCSVHGSASAGMRGSIIVQ